MDCPTCGKSFNSESAVKIHHTKSHGESIAGVEVECSTCGTTFRKIRANAEKYDRHFCSTECKSEGYKDRVTLTCDNCGEEFVRRRSAAEAAIRHYCSTECKGKAYRDRVELECVNCGKAFHRRRGAAIRADTHFCSTDCRGEFQVGVNAPNWNGGATISVALRRHLGGESWGAVRRDVFRNRESACRMCGATDEDRMLELHHIVPLAAGGSHHRENLMVLCVNCHGTVERFTESILAYPIAEIVAQHAD